MSRTGTAEVDGAALWYEVAGDGPAVVLLHPGLWDARTWDAQYAVLAERYRVLRYDIRGYGRSSRPEPGQPYSHVQDLAEVLGAAGIESAALVGCSLGGTIALDFALTSRERVWALVLAASGPGGFEGTPEEEAWWEDRAEPIEAAIEAGDLELAEDLRLGIWAPLGTEDAVGRRIRQIAFENIHEMTMDESGAEELDPPAIERLSEVMAPTLVLPAEQDPPFSRRMSRVLAEGIPSARIEEIPATDHVLNMRQAPAFNRLVLAFLDEVSP